MDWMAVGARVIDVENAEGTQASFGGTLPRLEEMTQEVSLIHALKDILLQAQP